MLQVCLLISIMVNVALILIVIWAIGAVTNLYETTIHNGHRSRSNETYEKLLADDFFKGDNLNVN